MTSLQDHMREAIMLSLLASPLRCPKELQKHVKRYLRKRAGSTGQRMALNNYRQAFTSYVARHGMDRILEASNVE